MANKMIIDASHPEETRVVVLRGNRVEEFDFESASKKPLRGNIYLAKVTRVEPSLQAAFVDYGGNRHGFLAFSEIHPDYYQIPVADRQALLEEEARSQRDEDEDAHSERRSRRHRRPQSPEAEMRAQNSESVSEFVPDGEFGAPEEAASDHSLHERQDGESAAASDQFELQNSAAHDDLDGHERNPAPHDRGDHHEAAAQQAADLHDDAPVGAPEAADSRPEHDEEQHESAPKHGEKSEPHHGEDDEDQGVTTLEGGAEERAPKSRADQASDDDLDPVEHIGGDALEEVPRRPLRSRRQYKIQEVIKRRQVLLVQVVKEERGNKGAALTTYLSLAGRYSVLMPNTARGGGISRKITNAQDRNRLKSIADELEVPEGMGIILRTAGAARTKPEVKRDFEYLLRMWETVRELTLASGAPTLVYEEGSLIKRAIRDLYNKDVEEIVVAGDAGYREARDFMRLLMPSHVKSVQPYRDVQPVFAKAGVEAQLDAMFSNQVTLKSGGYIVINQTEALVAIDVNSGRSTREHNIEDTALRTNLEAADEVARQLRLRDLAGLIVVDFIDMEEGRNNRSVERRMKDALKNDRARIQVGRISHFGLLEMSRQRIRTGVLEGSTVVCAHCLGAGVVRSTASVALHVLRVLEDALIKSATHDISVKTRSQVALYILNQKRAHLADIEARFGVAVTIEADDALTGHLNHVIERGELASGAKSATLVAGAIHPEDALVDLPEAEPEAEEVASVEDESEALSDGDEPMLDERAGRRDAGEAGDDSEAGRRRRRRRRRRGGERGPGENIRSDAPQPDDQGLARVAAIGGDLPAVAEGGEHEEAASEGGREPRGERPRSRRQRRPRRGERDRTSAPREPNVVDDSFAVGGSFDPPPNSQTSEAEPGIAKAAEPAPVRVSAIEAPGHDAGFDASTPVEPAPTAAREPRRSGWWQRAKATITGEN